MTKNERLLISQLRKVAAWLDRLAAHAEAQAKQPGQFSTLKDAYTADARNYRAVTADIRTTINKANGVSTLSSSNSSNVSKGQG